MDGAVDPATTREHRIGRIDDRVNFLDRDVSLYDSQEGIAELKSISRHDWRVRRIPLRLATFGARSLVSSASKFRPSQMTIPPFKERLESALRSTDLELALNRALPSLAERRNELFEAEDFPARQREAAQIRASAIDRLPELIEQFTAEAEAVGCAVYLAGDAAKACEIAGQIATACNAKTIVKGKSNLAEEIGLNEHLEGLGFRVVETDLGEWIVQLAKDRPSHTLAPALHMTKQEIAALISKAVGREIPDDREALVAAARDALRHEFFEADVGISGGNFAIADTGTLVLVTNEGNGRLLSTLPPVYIAIVGIEKIVPTLQDVTDILPMLTGSATGQKISTYVSLTTGPSRSADVEGIPTLGAHGPLEVHVILVDNGRSEMREDRDFRSALNCVKCGACSNVCPPFRIVGGHAFGYIYTGPIGIAVTGHHHGFENIAEAQSLCVGCGACEAVCPVGIPLPGLISEARFRVTAEKKRGGLKRSIVRGISSAKRMEIGLRTLSIAQLPATWGGDFVRMPVPGVKTDWRKLPAVSRKPLRDRREKLESIRPPTIKGSSAENVSVAYFPGCITDWIYPDMGEAAVSVIRACGATVTYPDAPSCCGLPALNAGEHDDAVRMAQQTIEAFESSGADYILSTSASCAVAIKDDYAHLFRDMPGWHDRARTVARRIVDFSGFMRDVARLPDGALKVAGPKTRVTYHDACQTSNFLRIRDEQRRLVTDVMGMELHEMVDSEMCCGFGGTFSFDHPEVSSRLLDRKLLNAEGTTAAVIVSDNPGCIMQLRGGIRARRGDLEVLHLAELMARHLP